VTPRTRLLGFLLLVFASLLVNQAKAHHNMTAVFDFNDRVTFTGTLTAVDWRNPHTYFTVEVKAAAGAIESWQSEGPAPSFFRIRDVGKADFEASVGKTVTVEVSRARDKSRFGLIRTFTLADGKIVSACPQNC
jgi:Family of unknown function (DUF6152)